MTLATDLDHLLAALVASPADAAVYGALADCLLERGDEVGADGVRWLRAKGRVLYPSAGSTFVQPLQGRQFAWGHAESGSNKKCWYPADRYPDALPTALFDALRAVSPSPTRYGNWFEDPVVGYATLLAAWRALPEADRAACWDWSPP